jgi:sirohydrochlorin cobaltochelatase
MEQDVRAAYPGRVVRWAYTSESLVARWRREGRKASTLPEAYARLWAEGFRAVAVLSLHLVPGTMHQTILEGDTHGLRRGLAGPLIGSREDLEATASRLVPGLPRERPVLVITHRRGPAVRTSPWMEALVAELASRRPDLQFASLGERAAPEALERFAASARAAGMAHVCPLFLVIGEALALDIQGDQPGSLKSMLGGADVTYGEALGSQRWVRLRLLGKLGEAIHGLKRGSGPPPGPRATGRDPLRHG